MPKTRIFDALYAEVTVELETYVNTRSDWSEDEKAWFRALIAAFQVKRDEWNTTAFEEIADYLKIFDGRKVGRELRLAGHVFLHIAFDLPRAIAETGPPPVSPGRRGQLFLAPSPLFPKIFMDFAKNGGIGMFGRLLGRVHAARILAFWVLALRAQCWVHGEILAEDRAGDEEDFGSEFEEREKEMARGMLAAAKAALGRRSVSGVSDLNNAELLPGASPFMVAQVSAGAWSVTALTAATAAIALYVGWRRRQESRSAIEVLGVFVHREMHRALARRPGEDRGPEPRPSAGARG